MRKMILFLSMIMCYNFLFASTVITKTPAEKKETGSAVSIKHMADDCTFTASVSFSVLGQEAEISCSSTQATCDQAITQVADCLKKAKSKIRSVLGI